MSQPNILRPIPLLLLKGHSSISRPKEAFTSAAGELGLVAPGLIVNTMKGDRDEHRAGRWLEWSGTLEGLEAALIGIPFDGASVVRTGSRHGPDAVRRSFAY